MPSATCASSPWHRLRLAFCGWRRRCDAHQDQATPQTCPVQSALPVLPLSPKPAPPSPLPPVPTSHFYLHKALICHPHLCIAESDPAFRHINPSPQTAFFTLPRRTLASLFLTLPHSTTTRQPTTHLDSHPTKWVSRPRPILAAPPASLGPPFHHSENHADASSTIQPVPRYVLHHIFTSVCVRKTSGGACCAVVSPHTPPYHRPPNIHASSHTTFDIMHPPSSDRACTSQQLRLHRAYVFQRCQRTAAPVTLRLPALLSHRCSSPCTPPPPPRSLPS